MNPTIQHWQNSLRGVLDFYETRRPRKLIFFTFLFLFFVIINDLCYWWAMITAFPRLTFGRWAFHYWNVQFPVAILGAVFDSLSFFVTVYIIRRALNSTSTSSFVSHLSIDLGIAILATFWVLFVFTLSSWLIKNQLFPGMYSLDERTTVYTDRALNALESPMDNLRNIYFGIVMGFSAMLPTMFHIYLAVRSFIVVRIRPAAA